MRFFKTLKLCFGMLTGKIKFDYNHSSLILLENQVGVLAQTDRCSREGVYIVEFFEADKTHSLLCMDSKHLLNICFEVTNQKVGLENCNCTDHPVTPHHDHRTMSVLWFDSKWLIKTKQEARVIWSALQTRGFDSVNPFTVDKKIC